jgi:hypothetical protein
MQLMNCYNINLWHGYGNMRNYPADKKTINYFNAK